MEELEKDILRAEELTRQAPSEQGFDEILELADKHSGTREGDYIGMLAETMLRKVKDPTMRERFVMVGQETNV